MKKFFRILKRVLLGILIIALLLLGYFLRVRSLDNRAREMKGFYVPDYDTSQPILLPTKFIDRERFFIKIPTTDGDTLLAFGDSGGGTSMLLPPATKKKQVKQNLKTAMLQGLMPVKYILFKDLTNDKIPPPYPMRFLILRRPFARVTEPFLWMPPTNGEITFMTDRLPGIEIFLGQNFFMGKAWTIDYIHEQIWVNTPIAASEAGKPGVQKIGFKKNDNKENIFGHGSMAIEVNGEVIDVLFDTGATMFLSDNGKKDLHTTAKSIGGSFIAASIFDKWRKEHPEWKYYKGLDGPHDAIEVPVVKIGGIEVGPALFSKRPDENWSRDMIGSMDKVVKGAIGGSAFKFLKVTVDYNSELIKFEQ